MENITFSLVAIILLLVANGFFVAAEFALVKARGQRIETFAKEGRATAKLTLSIQGNLEAYLAACQLGITMASLGLGWVGEPAVAALLEPLFKQMGIPDAALHTTAFIVGFLIFSSLHIVVGEQVPKTFAIRQAESVSMWIAYPLHISYLLVYPLNWLLNGATRTILSIFRVAEATHADVYSGDELKGLVSTSQEHGELEADRADMLRNLFEFDQRHVGRIMIPRTALKVLDVNFDGATNLQIIRDSGHSRFPLIDSNNNDEILGIILSKDLYAAMLRGEAMPWTDLRQYSRPAMVVPESQKISSLFDEMRSNRAHLTMVVDEYGELIGVVTLEDLLEEIVGEIEDETDNQSNIYKIIDIGNNCWEADGLASITDAERMIGFVVEDDLDANTLSGFFMASLERMPVVGDQVVEKGYRLTVQSADKQRIAKLLIEKLDESDSQETESEITTEN